MKLGRIVRVGVVGLMCLTGCGANTDDGPNADLRSAALADSPAPVCPAANAEHAATWYRTKAHHVAAYLLGASDPFASTDDQKDAAACSRATVCTTKMRDELASGRLEAVVDEGTSQACGTEVSTFTLEPTSGGADTDFAAATRCAAELDACWGEGVGAFFLPERAMRERKIHIDPDVARLLAALSGSIGSTAPAEWVSSGASTTVVLWPSTWTAGSSTPGMPCSAVSLPAGATTAHVIQAIGAFRRCL